MKSRALSDTSSACSPAAGAVGDTQRNVLSSTRVASATPAAPKPQRYAPPSSKAVPLTVTSVPPGTAPVVGESDDTEKNGKAVGGAVNC